MGSVAFLFSDITISFLDSDCFGNAHTVLCNKLIRCKTKHDEASLDEAVMGTCLSSIKERDHHLSRLLCSLLLNGLCVGGVREIGGGSSF